MRSLEKGKESFVTLLGDYEADANVPILKEMSVHYYRLNKGEADGQRPHREDELYYVLNGARNLEIEFQGKKSSVMVKPGDLVFVPALAGHAFIGDDEISVLAFFAPNFSGPEES